MIHIFQDKPTYTFILVIYSKELKRYYYFGESIKYNSRSKLIEGIKEAQKAFGSRSSYLPPYIDWTRPIPKSLEEHNKKEVEWVRSNFF